MLKATARDVHAATCRRTRFMYESCPIGYKARDPKAPSARGRVLYILYVPYLGIIYM